MANYTASGPAGKHQVRLALVAGQEVTLYAPKNEAPSVRAEEKRDLFFLMKSLFVQTWEVWRVPTGTLKAVKVASFESEDRATEYARRLNG